MYRLGDRGKDSFYNTLDEKISCNAGIHLFPITDGPYWEGGQPVTWLTIDVEKNDPEYVGRVVGKTVWNWWKNNADDVDFPSAPLLFDYAMEYYWNDVADETHAWHNDFFAIVSEVGLRLIEREYSALMRESWYRDEEFSISDEELAAIIREEGECVDSYNLEGEF
jgi:hypothetical protein